MSKRLSDYFPSVRAASFYSPGAMKFDGSTGYYVKTTGVTFSGNKMWAFARIKHDPFTTSSTYGHALRTQHSSNTRHSINILGDNNVTDPGGIQIFGRDSAGGVMYDIRHRGRVDDGEWHSVFYSYDADTGAYVFKVDGLDADVVTTPTLNTGTTPTGASGGFGIGCNDLGTSTVFYPGELSYVAFGDGTVTWSDFFTAEGLPKPINEDLWTEFGGSAPLFFAPNGDGVDNRGSVTSITKNGTIVTGGEAVYDTQPMNPYHQTFYEPASIKHTGSSNYRHATAGVVGSTGFSFIIRIKNTVTVTANAYLLAHNAGGGNHRVGCIVFPTTSLPNLFAFNSAGTQICNQNFTGVDLADGKEHILFGSYNASTGAYRCYDKHQKLNSGTTTTGTLGTTSAPIAVGAWHDGVQAMVPNGFQISTVGYDDNFIDWDDPAQRLQFITADGKLNKPDESGWTQWPAGQPLLWNINGEMNRNKGSVGSLTINGSPEVGPPELRSVRGQFMPEGLLFFHQFDGPANTPVRELVPDYDYAQQSVFSESGSDNIYLDGSGYLMSNGGYVGWVNPKQSWPSRAGKTRCYRVWGKSTNPVATSYFPTVQINYVDGSNFWSCRGMYNGSGYAQMYEWIAGGVGEGVRQSTSVFAASGEFEFDMVIRDYGDTVSMTLTYIDVSSKNSDLTVIQPQVLQLYKASRPNQEAQRFTFVKYETPSGFTDMKLRGVMVWDE